MKPPRVYVRFGLLALTLAIAGILFASSASAQAIGDAHETFLDASGAVQDGMRYGVGTLALDTEAPAGILASVTLSGRLDEEGISHASSAFAIATGYGESIREPLANFLRERAPSLVGAGPVSVAVEAYQLDLDITESVAIGVPNAVLTMAIPRVAEEEFGAPAAILGPQDAPVMIRVFSDFQCPYCQRFAREIVPMLEASVLERDDVALAFHHFPLNSIHANAEPAAVAAQCVRDAFGEEVFWPYHDLIFERMDAWKSLGDPAPYFVRLLADVPAVLEAAGTVETAEASVSSCVEAGEALAVVREATNRAIALGVQGTPTVYVGGYRMRDFGSPDAYLRLIRLERAVAGLDPTSAP